MTHLLCCMYICSVYLVVAGQVSDLLAQTEGPEADAALHSRLQQPAALTHPHPGHGQQSSLRHRLTLQHQHTAREKTHM